MAGASDQLLAAAVGYAVERLRAVATPQALAGLLGVALPDPDAVAGHVRSALDEATAAETLMPGDPGEAGKRLWRAVTQLRAAAALLGVADPAKALEDLVGGRSPAGLVRALGLPTPRAAFHDAPDDPALTLTWTGWRPPSPVPGTTLDRATVTARLSTDGLALHLRAEGLGVRVGADGDGLLALLVGAANDIRADVELTADHGGLTTRGVLGPVSVPAEADLGVVSLTGVDLRVQPLPAGAALVLAARLTGGLGSAVDAAVGGLGVRVGVDVPALLDGRPFTTLEPHLDVDLVALAVDAGVVTGGGMLRRAERPGGGTEYGGALELLLGPVEATAFGLLRDRDGGPSFAAVMGVRFEPAIELGLGFTLNGVGGLLGHNVTVDTGALSAGLEDGGASNLLFPDDPVASAPAVLDTLGRIFPASPGGFVVGPMLALGWGRPTLISLDVAVVLALPSPVLLVLGQARAAFPAPEAPVIDLRAGLYASFGAGSVLVVAWLEESRVGFAAVQGGFGMLIRFDDPATFVVTAGGFHPRFTHAPPELAQVDRISAALSPPVGLQLRLSGYLAVTPNTLQLGGSVEIAYSLAVVAVRGSLTLDALVQFEPFGFVVELVAKVGVEAFGKTLVGVDLALALEGPTPWSAKGTGTVRLPWPLPDPSIGVGPVRWGEDPQLPPPAPVSPLGMAVEALDLPEAWVRQDRAGQHVPVVLTPVPASDATLLEPWSLVRGVQRAVPLEMRLDRIGAHPAAPRPCTVSFAGEPTVGGLGGTTWSKVTEAFAVGQFVDLTEDAALTAPDFEDRVAGIVVDSSGASRTPVDRAAQAELRYEDCYPFEPGAERRRVPLWLLGADNLEIAVGMTAPARSVLHTADRYTEVARPLGVRPASDVRVADPRTFATAAVLTGPVGEAAEFGHWTDAAVLAGAVGLGGIALTKAGV